MADEARLWALAPVILIFAGLLFAALLWCLLSSCLGTPFRRLFSNLWEYTLLSAEESGAHRARRGLGEQEMWEMEHRRRTA